MVIWITGKAGAGKTTHANWLAHVLRQDGKCPVILDGDWVRDHWDKHGYTDEDRQAHQFEIAMMASYLEKQDLTPIIACVSPSQEVRKACRKLFNRSQLIYIIGGELWPGTSYDEPSIEELVDGKIIMGRQICGTV